MPTFNLVVNKVDQIETMKDYSNKPESVLHL